jgi:DNA-binding response OmpR family regulator
MRDFLFTQSSHFLKDFVTSLFYICYQKGNIMAQENKKVLIVDDEKDLVSLVALHMRSAGYEVFIANDGWTAIDMCKKNKPDLVILDLMLPKLNGWEVCRRIREDDNIKNIAVLMLSARGETDDKLRGFDVGADDYVTKPFSPKELVARVKRILARRAPESSQ